MILNPNHRDNLQNAARIALTALEKPCPLVDRLMIFAAWLALDIAKLIFSAWFDYELHVCFEEEQAGGGGGGGTSR